MPMCAALSSPLRLCGGVARAAPLFGGRRESSPQLRAPPRSGMRSLRLSPMQLVNQSPSLRLMCLRSPPSHNPPPRFQYRCCGVASATELCIAIERRRSPEIPSTLSEMPDDAIRVCDCPTTRARTILNFGDKKGKFSSQFFNFKFSTQL